MELFSRLFGDLLAFVYHCFDRIVIYGYLSGLSRPEQVVHFFRQVVGVPVVDKEVLSRRTTDYQAWVEAFARNHRLPIEWAEKGVRKEDHVLPWHRRMARDNAYGVYFIFKSMEQGLSFRVSVPKYAAKDPNYRILARQRSRFTHYYFYLRDETLGPMVMRVASFFPFHHLRPFRQRLRPEPTPLRPAQAQGARPAAARRLPLRQPSHSQRGSGCPALSVLPQTPLRPARQQPLPPPPDPHHQPASKLEAAYHRADNAIQQIVAAGRLT
jgi:hypothetical protein